MCYDCGQHIEDCECDNDDTEEFEDIEDDA